jgi:hypothetical protein
VHSVRCEVGSADVEQPLLMEVLLLDGLCVSQKDFNVSSDMWMKHINILVHYP